MRSAFSTLKLYVLQNLLSSGEGFEHGDDRIQPGLHPVEGCLCPIDNSICNREFYDNCRRRGLHNRFCHWNPFDGAPRAAGETAAFGKLPIFVPGKLPTAGQHSGNLISYPLSMRREIKDECDTYYPGSAAIAYEVSLVSS